MKNPVIKIGIGYDIHRFQKGRSLYLGGVLIPHTHGLKGHSDADALLHALIDALLGALSCGDIGDMFPDTEPRYKGCRSTLLLERVMRLVRQKGFRVASADTVIIAEAPKLSGYKTVIKENLCRMLGVPDGGCGVKAKTNEGLGEIGAAKAIACYATVLLSCARR